MLVGSIASEMSFEKLWKAVEPYIIGVWKYRKPGEPVKWSATYLVDGAYWDVGISDTVEEALMKVILQRSHQVRQGGHLYKPSTYALDGWCSAHGLDPCNCPAGKEGP